MTLDYNCFRKILLYIEEHCVYENAINGRKMHEVSFYEICNADKLKEFNEETKRYIVSKLLCDGYVNGKTIPKNDYENFSVAFISSLTMKGHNMVDNISNEHIWNNAIDAMNMNGKVSIDILAREVDSAAHEFAHSVIHQSLLNTTPDK